MGVDLVADVGIGFMSDMGVDPVADMGIGFMSDMGVDLVTDVGIGFMSDMGIDPVADVSVGFMTDVADAGTGGSSHEGGRHQNGGNGDSSFQHCNILQEYSRF
jgi:hypothetical protein